jgi:hypothetical protein
MTSIELNQSCQFPKIQLIINYRENPAPTLWKDLLKDSVGFDTAKVRTTNNLKSEQLVLTIVKMQKVGKRKPLKYLYCACWPIVFPSQIHSRNHSSNRNYNFEQ